MKTTVLFMKKIKVENTEFFIETGNALAPEFPLKVNNPEQLKLLDVYSGSDVRLMLVPSFFKIDYGNLYWLFWIDPKTSDKINEKITHNTFTDNDFLNSVKTFYQITECSNCKRKFDTLIIPPGDPYPGNPKLLAKKIGLSKFQKCPACNFGLRQMVVKIIGEHKKSDSVMSDNVVAT